MAGMDAATGPLSQPPALLTDVLRTMARTTVVKELCQFLMAEKKYWLLPLVLMFVLLGMLISVSQTSALAPFIYTLF